MTLKKITQLVILLFTALVLNACSDDKPKKKTISAFQEKQTYKQDTKLYGKIKNSKQTLFTGIVKATHEGQVIATHTIKDSSKYELPIKSGTELPILLTFYPDKNSKNQDKLLSVVISPMVKKYSIDDLTTLIAKKANKLGGYTFANVALAADSTVGIPDANKTSTGFRGDPTKQYGGWH